VLAGFLETEEKGGFSKLRKPWEALSQNARFGLANMPPDLDGVVRKVELLFSYKNDVYPSLAVAALAASNNKTLEQAMPLLDRIETDDRGSMILNYCGGYKTFPYVPYGDALNGTLPGRDLQKFLEHERAPRNVLAALGAASRFHSSIDQNTIETLKLSPDELSWKLRMKNYLSNFYRDKIVFVGGSAPGLFDHMPTPFVPICPGVEVQATALENLLSGSYLRPPPGWLDYVGIFFIGLLMGFCLPALKPWTGAALAFLTVLGTFSLGYILFIKYLWAAHFVVYAVNSAACYIGVVSYRLIIEEREKRWIKSAFSQYLSPKVIVILIQDPSRLRLGGEERELTILFSDVEHFTSLSEELSTAQLVEVLNQYLSLMSDVILKYDGVVDKYVGDAIIAFWNAPLDQAEHARIACMAALESQAVLSDLRGELQSRGIPPVFSRIGINTGIAKVGNMGSKTRLSYTAIGDSVNLASRLEGANKAFGTYTMISETTYQYAKEYIEARVLDRIVVVGRRQPILVYELLAKKGEISKELKKSLDYYGEALHLYYPRRDFLKAKDLFRRVLDLIPRDPVANLYMARCDSYLRNPPSESWDGVFILASK